MANGESRPNMRPLLLAVLFLAIAACGGSRPQGGTAEPTPAAAPRPTMLLAAAGARSADAVARLIGASEQTRPRVLVISAGTDTVSGPQAAMDLRTAGAIATSIRLTRTMAESGQISALLSGVQAVWFTGTNPADLGAALGGTPTATAIVTRADAGMRVGGDGAGAGMVAAVLIAGGDLPPPRRRGRQPPDEGVVTAEGLGILRGTLVYAPASSRRKADALDSALAAHPTLVGVQLDSGAAMTVMPDGVWQSVGIADVLLHVPDGSSSDSMGVALHRTRILSPGSRFDPRTRTMLPLLPPDSR